MAARSISFNLSGLGAAPNPEDVLYYGRAVASRSGISLPEDARPTITQASDGSDNYHIEIPTELAS